MKVTVARIGKAHGLKGEVSLILRTDVPELRFVPGAQFDTEDGRTFTLVRARQQSGRWYGAFDELTSREDAEAANGVELVIDGTESDEEDAWYVHELVGLTAKRPDGSVIGEVVDLLDMPAHDVLVVKQPSGHRAMIPFIEDFVPEVDVAQGAVVVTPPFGLLEGEDIGE